MANSNPHRARAALRRKRAAGDLQDARAALWAAIESVERIRDHFQALDALSLDDACKVARTIASCADSYARLHDVIELAPQMAELKQMVQEAASRRRL